MRIAYHNPWVQSSENQGYMSMAEAGRRIGIELVACADAAEIEACRPDFVISVASSMAKIVDIPTYLTVHEPKAFLFEQPKRLRNLFSYDGYLTISDSLVRFIRDFCYGTGRIDDPGFCYLTPQISALRSDWSRPDRAETLRVVYFGTNWHGGNRRMPLMFRALDPMGILRIHGPEASWRPEGYESYCGPVAFDGIGPQRAYAEYGIGLALMDERWQREDVISNRVFEISSVGAVSICPDMAWTRKWFGDSVLYFDPERPMREIADQVRAHHAFCRANPEAARQMGERARGIFEAHFAAERMLQNAVAYHARKTEERARRRAAMPPAPEISVVVRCGGRGLDVIRRAVGSIRRQSFGRFTVILAKYRDIDLSPVTADLSGAIAGFDEFLIEGGGRAEMLFAGAARVATPYFAVLDDDDFWLHDHFEELFRAGLRVRPDFDMAFSGCIGFDYPVPYTDTLSSDRNILRFGYDPATADLLDITNAIGTNCFVARRDLLTEEMLQVPQMRTAEDSLLIGLLAWRSRPIFSYRTTAFYRRDPADGSNWWADRQRTEDEISLALRAGLSRAPAWLASGSFAVLTRIWEDARVRIGSTLMGEILDRLWIGSAGERVKDGIAARPGTAGHVCHGPYVTLPPDRYLVTFLLQPAPDDAAAGSGPIGAVDVYVVKQDLVLAQQDIAPGTTEITLHFTVPPDQADARVEFRVLSHRRRFTVTSVSLYRDLAAADADPATPPPPPAPAAMPPAPDPVAAAPAPPPADPLAGEIETLRREMAALQAELLAVRHSTSWRVTAPLRQVGRLLRRP